MTKTEQWQTTRYSAAERSSRQTSWPQFLTLLRVSLVIQAEPTAPRGPLTRQPFAKVRRSRYSESRESAQSCDIVPPARATALPANAPICYTPADKSGAP